MNPYKTGPWLVAFAAFLWAVDAPFRKFLTEGLSSTTIVFMEHITIAALVFIFLARYLKELKNLSGKEWLAVIFIAFGGSALATVFFTQSFAYVSPTVAILLQKIQPFIAILLAVVILKERLSKWFWLLALVGVFGAYLISFPQLAITGFAVRDNMGIVFALLAAFLWGGSTVFGRYVLRKVSFQAMTAVRFLGALVFLFFIQMYYGRVDEINSASGKDWMYIFIIAILAGFISLFIYYRGLKYTKAGVATIAELAFPLSAVVVNWKFLGDTLTGTQLAGGAILLLAVLGLSFVNAKQRDILEESHVRQNIPTNQ